MKCRFSVVAMIVLSFSATLEAQTYFTDEFDDGSDIDGNPVAWIRGLNPNAERKIVDGAYQWKDSDLMSSVVGDLNYTDVFVGTRAKLLTPANPFTFVAVFARDSPAGAYFSGIRENGNLFIGIDDFARNRVSILKEQSSALDFGSRDVHIQFGVLGEQLSLSAWEEGSQMPSVPQISVRDSTLSEGRVGIVFHPFGRETSVAFSSFAAVPEPSSAFSAMAALFWFFGHFRRARPRNPKFEPTRPTSVMCNCKELLQ